MLKTTLVTLTAIVSAVLAGSVNITSPQQGDVWEAGKEVDIVWYEFFASLAKQSSKASVLLTYHHSIGMLPPLEAALFPSSWLPAPLRHYLSTW
jgi:hypothetical protein